MINQTVLMSGVDFFSDDAPINPFMDAEVAINLDVARREHAAIGAALAAAGVSVVGAEPPADCQDGVFTANWALVRGDLAVLARLPNARKGEEAYARDVLENLGKTVIELPPSVELFSGQGDALPCGDYLFCGSTYRSDVRAQEFVADKLGFTRIQLRAKPLLDERGQPVINAHSGLPDSFYYDLDLAISILKAPENGQKGLIAWCPEAFTAESQALLRSFDAVDKIEVSESEAVTRLACNLVSTGSHVIMNNAPELAAAIEAHGLTTTRLDNPEIAKGGGSVRCVTLTLE